MKPSKLIVGNGPKGADFDDGLDSDLLHLTNWVQCMRSRKKPTAPAEAGALSAVASQMANQAYREQRVVKYKARKSK